MNTNQHPVIAPGGAKVSRQMRRAARFAPGKSIKIRFGGRMMLMVWRTRARVAQLLGRLLDRSLRRLALVAVSSTMVPAVSYAFATTGAFPGTFAINPFPLIPFVLIPPVTVPPVNVPAVINPLSSSAGVARLPSNGTVVGTGSVTGTLTNPNLLTINQTSPQAIVNWNSFNIAPGYKVNFVQPGASASILNRVTGESMSSIQGQIEANGKVWLINPAGIMIGSGATINVAGFVASTLQVSDTDFLANRLTFTGGTSAGTVTNNGAITTSPGGGVYLVGATVNNTNATTSITDPGAVITTPLGKTVLAAGETVTITLADTTLPGVKVEVTGTSGSVNNLGKIVSQAGSIGLAGAFVRNAGTLDVKSVATTDGRIFLQATQNATIGSGSDISTGLNGTLAIDGPAAINGASLSLGGGALTTNGTLDVTDSTLSNLKLTAPGLVNFYGSNALNTDVALSDVAINYGALLHGTGKLTATNLSWRGGTISGNANDPAYDIMNLNVRYGGAYLDGRTMNLLPRGVSDGGFSYLELSNGAKLNNFGTFDLQYTLINFNGSSTFNNSGTIKLYNYSEIGDDPRYINAGKSSFNNLKNGTIEVSHSAPFSSHPNDNFLGSKHDALNGVSFNNAGTVNITDSSLFIDGDGSHTGLFNIKSTSAQRPSILSFGVPVGFNRNGQYAAGSTTQNINDQAQFLQSGSGTTDIIFSNNAKNITNINTSVLVDNASINNGIVQGTGKLTVTNLNWLGGKIAGSAEDPSFDIKNLVIANPVITFLNGPTGVSLGERILDGRTLNLVADGNSSITSATLAFNNNATLNNSGTLALSNGATLRAANVISRSSGVINNYGTINADAHNTYIGEVTTTSPGLISIGSDANSGNVVFNNTGNLNIKSGTLQLNSPLVINNRGQIQIDTGATLATNVDLSNAQGAKISGSGTLQMTGYTLTNDGVVSPGTNNSTGTLTINGNYIQGSTGELIAKISAGDVAQYDQLSVSGSTHLDGQLSVRSLNGYVPAAMIHST